MFLEEQLWKLIIEDPDAIDGDQPQPGGDPNAPGLRRKRKLQGKKQPELRRTISGKMGAKRSNRFMNQLYLNQPSHSDQDLVEEPDSLFEEWTSPISLVFEPKYKALWEPFIDITEEQQKKLLEERAPKVKQRVTRDQVRLNKLMRTALVKNRDSEVLHETEKELVDFAQGNLPKGEKQAPYFTSNHVATKNTTQLKIHFHQDYHRLLAHAVSRFYNLESHSIDCGTQRVFVVTMNKNHRMPPVSLTDYLKQF